MGHGEVRVLLDSLSEERYRRLVLPTLKLCQACLVSAKRIQGRRRNLRHGAIGIFPKLLRSQVELLLRVYADSCG